MQSAATSQIALSQRQIEAFYHDEFVEDQLNHFLQLAERGKVVNGRVVDVGGGRGFFATCLEGASAFKVRVMDTDAVSVGACDEAGLDAVVADALSPPIEGDETIACFNLILHHLVSSSEANTRKLQRQALEVWRPHVKAVFVNEYIYESYLKNASGWLIFQITKSRILSALGRAVAYVVPAFRANTFGVGVRFRAHDEWRALFHAAGYEVKAALEGMSEPVSPVLRLLLIKDIRRDSFLLEPAGVQSEDPQYMKGSR